MLAKGISTNGLPYDKQIFFPLLDYQPEHMVGCINVQPHVNASNYLGYSNQAAYIQLYTKEIGSNKIVVEEDYTDKDYILDFQRFYSRSFGEKEWRTTRVHFFGGNLTCEELREELLLPSSTKSLQSDYLGFVVVKPVRNGGKQFIIGRTVLSTYPENAGDHRRIYIESLQRANIFGHELFVKSLPFQSQDRAVGACASAALWSASNQLFHLFETQRDSMYGITEEANRGVVFESRAFPSQGLTYRQMCGYLRMKGLELEFFQIAASNNKDEWKDFISTVLKSFTEAGIPIIAGIALHSKVVETEGDKDAHVEKHAIVISGYSLNNNGEFNEIYVHDDQIGPYASVISSDGFLTWKYKTGGWSNYPLITLDSLIVPLYHKIRLPFLEVWMASKYLSEDSTIREHSLHLYEVRNYRKRILNLDIDDKETLLTTQMPRYVWVFEATRAGGVKEEVVLDATAVYPTIVAEFTYNSPIDE